MKRVVYHRLAANELIEAAVFYEKRRPLLGDEFLNEADATRDKIAENPARGRSEQFALRSLKMRGSLTACSTTLSRTGCGLWPWRT
jgi:hypothetical protein